MYKFLKARLKQTEMKQVIKLFLIILFSVCKAVIQIFNGKFGM